MKKFDPQKNYGKIMIPFEINGEMIVNVLSDAYLSGGIDYWARVDEQTDNSGINDSIAPSEWHAQLLCNGKSVFFRSRYYGDREVWELTLDKLLQGLTMYLTDVLKARKLNLDEWDCISADTIIQYALFGKIVCS